MATDTELADARTVADEPTAVERFAEATRSAAFSLNLGVREVRMLAGNNFHHRNLYTASEHAAMQRLIDKGLLLKKDGEAPKLSEAGELVRRLMVISKHVVIPDTPRHKVCDMLDHVKHSINAIGGRCAGWLVRAGFEKDSDGKILGLVIREERPDYEERFNLEMERPRKKTQWLIKADGIERIG